jgi:hypothetical protein
LNSCSKEKDEVAKTEPISLSTEKSQYAPYEIVTISASENLFTVDSFTAKINDIEVKVGSKENAAAFLLPNLANGNYNLSFTINDKNYIVPIIVTSLSNILSSDQYFNEIQTNINQNISSLNSQITQLEQNSTNTNEYATLKNDVVKYTNLLNEYTTSYNNLSAADKQEFAKTMAANKPLLERLDNLNNTLQSSTVTLRKAQSNSIRDYEAEVEAASQAYSESVDEMGRQIPKIVGCAIVAYTPIHPIINAGAILATGILVAKFMVTANKTITAAITLTDKSLKPFEFNTTSSQTIYNSDVETDSNIAATYRSLINSDSNNSGNGSTINKIVEKYNYFKGMYNDFVSDLPSIFRPNYIMTSLKNTYNSTTRSIYNKYVSITDVSNPNVTLQQLNQPDGSIKIKATTTATTDQTFTYTVKYTNNSFTNNLNKTVNAKVLAVVDSIPIYTASALGVYTVNGPPAVGNGPNSELHCELKAGGVAVYTIYHDTSWPDGYSWNIGWHVTKANNKYYIVTGWTNPGYLIGEAQPLTYPITRFVYRNAYVK